MQYMAIDIRSEQTFHGLGPHPRKELLKRLGRKHCQKMYLDKKDGPSVHIGWIIAGMWLEVYEVKRVEWPA
jgi:hypothetical protein